MKFIVVLLVAVIYLVVVVHGDCGTTPYETAVQLVGQQCIDPPSLYVDESTNIVYATCFWGFYGCSAYYDYDCYNVIAINGSTITNIATSTQCLEPSGIYGKNGMIYVACSKGNVISIHGTSGAIATVISAADCPEPHDIFVTSDTIYVACYRGNVISVPIADPTTITTIVTKDLVPTPCSVYYLAGVVYVSSHTGGAFTSGTVFSISGSTVTDLTPGNVCPTPTAVMASSDGTAYAACNDGHTGVVSISSSGGIVNIIATVDQCMYPSSIAMDNNGAIYVACWFGDTISIVGTNVTALIPMSECNPIFTWITSTGVIYNACQGPNRIVKSSPCV
jgi:hypothetical protein